MSHVAVGQCDDAVSRAGDGINRRGIQEAARELAQVHIHRRVRERDAVRLSEPVQIIFEARVARAAGAGIIVVGDTWI